MVRTKDNYRQFYLGLGHLRHVERRRCVLNDPRRSDPAVAQDIADRLVAFFNGTGVHSPPEDLHLAP